MEAAGLPDAFEEGRFRRRHPHLSAPFQPGEQGRTALGIKVRGNFIEEQDRRIATAVGDQFGMSENKPE